MRRLLLQPSVFAASVALSACFSPSYNNPTCGPGGSCPSGLSCVGNVCIAAGPNDALVDDTLLDGECATAAVCENSSTLRDCSGTVTCDLGCADSPTPHCRQIVPSNNVDSAVTGQAGPLAPTESAVTIDTDTGSISTPTSVIRPGGIGLMSGIYYGQPTSTTAVFGMQEMTIPSATTVSVVGVRAAVLVARDKIQIDGEVVLRGQGVLQSPGPGGGVGGSSASGAGGCGPGAAGSLAANNDGGGGGGAFGDGGGSGGYTDAGVAAPGGMTCGSPTLEPLMGGAGGGRGGGVAGGVGGGGGGAAQFVSLTAIVVNGAIDASGRGGGGAGAGDDAAGGGGAGGGILLEAPSVTTSGKLHANGGSGGGGTMSGTNGLQSNSPALGGAVGACKGGNGGSRTAIAEAGGNNCSSPSGTAGGGGGVGRIRVNFVSPTSSIGGFISPAATTGTAVVQ